MRCMERQELNRLPLLSVMGMSVNDALEHTGRVVVVTDWAVSSHLNT